MNKIGKLIFYVSDFFRYGYLHSGERVNPTFQSKNFLNHFEVYKFASQFCTGKRLLDIGCGTGYGTHHLSLVAQTVVGIDISGSAIRYAKAHYSAKNLSFQKMNAQKLMFPDGSFDFIISTENFEHLAEQTRAAQELGRVLDPDGMCLLATPNPEAFVGITNRFHTHECTYNELVEIFSPLFGDVAIVENSLTPKYGRGVIANGSLRIFGHDLDVTHLSNTHSFFCFLRAPLC